MLTKETVNRGAINCVFAAASQATLWRRAPLKHSSGGPERAQENVHCSAQGSDQGAVTPTALDKEKVKSFYTDCSSEIVAAARDLEGPAAVPAVFCRRCGSENMVNELLCHQCARPIDQDDALALKSASDISEVTSRQYEIRWRRVLTGKHNKNCQRFQACTKAFQKCTRRGFRFLC